MLDLRASDDLKNVFIIMDFEENDLKSTLNLTNTIEFTEFHVKTILYNILCALNLLHKSNVMHRDIKPSNILINRDCQVKLCDFGMARTIPQD